MCEAPVLCFLGLPQKKGKKEMDSGINASDSQGAVFVLCPYDYMNGYVSIFLIRISAICLKQAKLYQSLPTTKKNLIANCNATSYAACVRDYVKLNKDVCATLRHRDTDRTVGFSCLPTP